MSVSENRKVGFLQRRPEKIDPAKLYDGGYLLPAEDRDLLEKVINSEEGDQKIEIQTEHANLEVYIIGQEAFVLEPHLGTGIYGEVYIVQNALNGTWHCMKKFTNDTLQPIELEVLKQEGLYRASSKISDHDIFGNALKEKVEDFRKEGRQKRETRRVR